MSLFNQLGQNPVSPSTQQPQTPSNPAQMLQQLKGDPGAFLKQAGYDIPAGMNNPQQIVKHLMNSGQVTNQRYQQAQQMMQRMGRRK